MQLNHRCTRINTDVKAGSVNFRLCSPYPLHGLWESPRYWV